MRLTSDIPCSRLLKMTAAGLGAHQPHRRLRLAAEPQTGRREVSAPTDARKTLAYDFFRILRAPLKEVCVRLGAKVRRSDMIGRLGGEEFAILLPCTDQSGAARLAEHLRSALAAEPVEGIGTVTGSFGVAQLDIEAGETIEALLARADAALYDAKASGRNCVAVASDATLCVDRKSSYPQFLGTKPRRGAETSWPTTV